MGSIRDVEIKGSFLVFDSGGGWAFLLGKPLLTALRAVHDYGEDVIKIRDNKTQVTLINQYHDQTHSRVIGNGKPTLDIKQVTQQHEYEYTKQMQIPRIKSNKHPDVTNKTIVERAVPTYISETSIPFTRRTDPFNPRRVEYIIKSVKVGENTTRGEKEQVEALIAEYADIFACSLSEVTLIPGAMVDLNVPKEARFNTNIRQRPLSPPQKQYMHKWVQQMLDANMIERADVTWVKHVAPTVLTQKTHDAAGAMTLEDLQIEVNRQCEAANIPPPFNKSQIESQRNNKITRPTTSEPTKWRVTQNFAELNKVTQIPPLHQGDIRAKQQ